MSANVEVLRRSEMMESPAAARAVPPVGILGERNNWNPENFAREQIRGLVRRVFFTNAARQVRHVVFCAVDHHTDVASLCDRVGRALAVETSAHIAILGREPRAEETLHAHPHNLGSAAIKSRSTQLAGNLWRLPEFGPRECGEESGTGRYWLSCLAELRTEFEYAVIHGPAAGVSSEAVLLGQLADGIVLVLGAHSTRRAAARKIKETLEGTQSRILGTVLSERRFPVPERIYRRL